LLFHRILFFEIKTGVGCINVIRLAGNGYKPIEKFISSPLDQPFSKGQRE